MSAHTSLFSGTWVEGSRIDFQFYKDSDIYSRKGVGVAFNPTRFKEKKTNRAGSPLSRQHVTGMYEPERDAADRVTLLFTLAMVSKAGGSLCNWGV